MWSALADAMRAWAGDPQRRRRSGAAAQAVGECFRPERYAEDFEDFVRGIISAPRRRTLAALGGRAIGRFLLRRHDLRLHEQTRVGA